MTFYTGSIPNPGVTRTRLSGNTPTTVLAAANQSQAVAKITVANTHSSAVTATVDVYDGTNTTVLRQTVSIAAAESLEIYDELLDQGESLRVTSGEATGLLHIHVIHALTNV